MIAYVIMQLLAKYESISILPSSTIAPLARSHISTILHIFPLNPVSRIFSTGHFSIILYSRHLVCPERNGALFARCLPYLEKLHLRCTHEKPAIPYTHYSSLRLSLLLVYSVMLFHSFCFSFSLELVLQFCFVSEDVHDVATAKSPRSVRVRQSVNRMRLC